MAHHDLYACFAAICRPLTRVVAVLALNDLGFSAGLAALSALLLPGARFFQRYRYFIHPSLTISAAAQFTPAKVRFPQFIWACSGIWVGLPSPPEVFLSIGELLCPRPSQSSCLSSRPGRRQRNCREPVPTALARGHTHNVRIKRMRVPQLRV